MAIHKTYNDLEDRQNCLRSGLSLIYSVKIEVRLPVLGVFAKLRKGNYQLRHVCLSLRPSVLMEQLGSY
jgi:hypothetical protein